MRAQLLLAYALVMTRVRVNSITCGCKVNENRLYARDNSEVIQRAGIGNDGDSSPGTGTAKVKVTILL